MASAPAQQPSEAPPAAPSASSSAGFPRAAFLEALKVPSAAAQGEAPYVQRLALHDKGGGEALVAASTSERVTALVSVSPRAPLAGRGPALSLVTCLQGHGATVTSTAFARVRAWGDEVPPALVTAAEDGRVALWDVREGRPRTLLAAPPGMPLHSAACNGDVVVGGSNGPLFVWRAANGAPLAALPDGHTEDVTQLAFHPLNPAVLLSASDDGLVNVYNLEKEDAEEALEVVLNVEQPVARFGFYGPQGEMLYAITQVETLSLWHVERGERVASVDNVRGALSAAAGGVTVDYVVDCFYDAATRSLFLAAGNWAGLLLVFLVRDDALVPVYRLDAHTAVVRDVAWHGSYLVSCGEDGLVCLWSWEPALVDAMVRRAEAEAAGR